MRGCRSRGARAAHSGAPRGGAPSARLPRAESTEASDQLCDQLRRARGAVGLNRPVTDLASDLLGDRRCNLGRTVGLEVHAAPRAVAVQAVAHVEVLLEVMA